MMNLVIHTLVLGALASLMVEPVSSDAFFLTVPSLSVGGRPAHGPPARHRLKHAPARNQFRQHKAYRAGPQATASNSFLGTDKQTFPVKSGGKAPSFHGKVKAGAFNQPRVPNTPSGGYNKRLPNSNNRYPPQRPTPAAIKLDYSGWKAIGFDDTIKVKKSVPLTIPYSGQTPSIASGEFSAPPPPLNTYVSPSLNAALPPVVSNYIYKDEDPDVVTIEDAIGNAPPAQSDDTYRVVAFSGPAPEPIVSLEVVEPVVQVETLPVPTKPLTVVSTFGEPVPAVPYIPSTFDASLPVRSNPVKSHNAGGLEHDEPEPPVPTIKYSPVVLPPATPAPAQEPQYVKSLPAKFIFQQDGSLSSSSKFKRYQSSFSNPTTTTTTPRPYSPTTVSSTTTVAPTTTRKSFFTSGAYHSQRGQHPRKVVLPNFTPAPAIKTSDDKYTKSASVTTYTAYSPSGNAVHVGGHSEEKEVVDEEGFPIISLLTEDDYDSLPEEERYVSFDISGDSPYRQLSPTAESVPQPGSYQNTGESANLAEEVSSGTVYVQQHRSHNSNGKHQFEQEAEQLQEQEEDDLLNDELFYIYYQDSDKNAGNYGSKVARELPPQPDSEVAPFHHNLPLYDYEDDQQQVDLADPVREVRQNKQADLLPIVHRARQTPSHSDTKPAEAHNSFQAFANAHNIGSQSRVTFNLMVDGKESGFSYNL